MPSFELPLMLSRPVQEMNRLPAPDMMSVTPRSGIGLQPGPDMFSVTPGGGIGIQPAPDMLSVTPLGGAGIRPVGPAFGDVLNSYLRQTDQAQHRADQMVESLALGEPVDVHQVMMALGEAANAMHLTMAVRGKVLEAYQELMRMPL